MRQENKRFLIIMAVLLTVVAVAAALAFLVTFRGKDNTPAMSSHEAGGTSYRVADAVPDRQVLFGEEGRVMKRGTFLEKEGEGVDRSTEEAIGDKAGEEAIEEDWDEEDFSFDGTWKSTDGNMVLTISEAEEYDLSIDGKHDSSGIVFIRPGGKVMELYAIEAVDREWGSRALLNILSKDNDIILDVTWMGYEDSDDDNVGTRFLREGEGLL